MQGSKEPRACYHDSEQTDCPGPGIEDEIGDVEYQGDGNKAIFYYIADERVDFRQLIKVLADTFHVRIEMKQIGARQEAGRIGGTGPCGRELCCATWMKNFVSVSTNAARYQDISLNPQKLAGMCAKLKCCLNYEVDNYVEASRKMPPKDAVLQTADGEFHQFKVDILAGLITYSSDKNLASNLETITAARAKEIIEMNRNGEKPLSLLENGKIKESSKPIDLLNESDLSRFDKSKKRKRKITRIVTARTQTIRQTSSRTRTDSSRTASRARTDSSRTVSRARTDSSKARTVRATVIRTATTIAVATIAIVSHASSMVVIKTRRQEMKRLIYLILVMVATMSLPSCKHSTVFDSYAHTPIAGWEKNDTLSFEIPPLLEGGYYNESLGLRITGNYPFMGLTLIVEQNIYHNNKHVPSACKTDTVNCQLIDKNGVSKGQGISYYQYNFPINVYRLNQGDSIHITVRHDMKREILPGVSDIGVKITKNDQ